MPLSDEDKKRIEEEEYRKHVQSKMQDAKRVDVYVKSDERVETHGVGREAYHDAKGCVSEIFEVPYRLALALMGGCIGAVVGAVIGIVCYALAYPFVSNPSDFFELPLGISIFVFVLASVFFYDWLLELLLKKLRKK